jgi:GxxExxY protein
VVIEIKAVEAVLPVFKAQLLSYLKLSGNHLGLLINFHVTHLRGGIVRMVSGAQPQPPQAASAHGE